MAKIHGISGSTQYLLSRINAINGKRLTTLEEMSQFYNNYEKILADSGINIGKQQDKIISNLGEKELFLLQELEKGISQKTDEVNGNLEEMNNKIKTSKNFLKKVVYSFQYWLARSTKSYRINSPFSGVKKEIYDTKMRKENLIKTKPYLIKYECSHIINTYNSLKANRSFFWGAEGEELVISELTKLPDEYHVLNDVNLSFNRAIYWREKDQYIKTSQIDHIVVGPTGLFLLETKNWKLSDIDIKSDELVYQVSRSSLALWYFLKDFYRKDEMPLIRKVVVSIQGYGSNQKLDKYIDITTPYRLCGYIASKDIILSEDAIKNLIATIPWHE